MSLYHIYRKRWIQPGDLEKSKYFKLAVARIAKISFHKFCEYIDDFIDEIPVSKKSDLRYATTAILLGYRSKYPVEANEIHAAVSVAAKCHPKTHNIMLGVIVMWRFSLHDEEWLCAEEDTGSINEDGEMITRTYYWIKPSTAYVPRPFTPTDLINKFNSNGFV